MKVYAHRIGTDQLQDILVFEELDDTVFVDITSSKDGKYVNINANTLNSSEVRVLRADHDLKDNQKPDMRLIEPRTPGVEYYVDHHDDNFYILTNADDAINFKLVQATDYAFKRKDWSDVIKMRPTEKIEDVDLFKNHVVIYGRKDGLPMILCHNLQTGKTHEVPLPEKFCVLSPGTNLEFDTDTFRFSVTSPFMHESTYEYNMSTQKLHPVRVQNVQSINPVLMRSYGAYGTSTDIDFRVEQFPLIERGWVIALAHVSFKDFISVAEHLVHHKLTSPDYLAAMGTSAGGLLVGAMFHMRPTLFKALVLRVPFVDPLSAMLNPELPLTQVEYPEWGNPTKDPKAYQLIQSYSPYENINLSLFSKNKDKRLASLFVTGGMKDQRVAYWQPLKFVARLRYLLSQQQNRKLLDNESVNEYNKNILLKMDLDRGHFGGNSEQDSRLSDVAEEIAFLITQVQQ
ncbi:prolyl oligopeptidase [Mycotypha africana]|uniref:prolyl oligopeptidase n=1 Tax=Mycotypha africana TaxID=64632 RepID=UPI0023008E05|nr:prolyl oligopeptidase [Mycotypha africana]KAI8987393.1 prolyl oligopeptidase [Mycotypha africana]